MHNLQKMVNVQFFIICTFGIAFNPLAQSFSVLYVILSWYFLMRYWSHNPKMTKPTRTINAII